MQNFKRWKISSLVSFLQQYKESFQHMTRLRLDTNMQHDLSNTINTL